MKKAVIAFLAVIILFFAGCKKPQPVPTKDDYIKASIEAMCLTVEHPDLFSDKTKGIDQLKAIFKKYSFPVDDDKKMTEIADSYKNLPDVQAAVNAQVATCIDKVTSQQPTTPKK